MSDNKKVSIFMGGTGANNAADARTNLGAAPASAANTVRVSQNGASTLSGKQLNFVNTANVTIAVTDAGDGNANVEIFSAAGGGGGSGIVIVRDNFTGDGNTVNFTLTTEPQDESHTLVFVDLVFQSETAYSVSGDTLTFGAAPEAGANIDVYIYGSVAGSTVVTTDLFAGTGSCTSYQITQTSSTSKTFVYLDGVAQRPAVDYQVSGTTLSFNVAPTNATVIHVTSLSSFTVTDINVAPVSIYSDKFTGTGACTQFTMTQAGTTDSTFVFLNGVSQKPGNDFSVGGVGNTTLTMTSAPANGSVLEVRSMGPFKLSENQSRIDSDIFSGDGNTTVFTLSTTTTTKKALVFIDGVAQKPVTDYGIGGNLITFVEAPPAGTSIEVRSISPFVFATTSAELAYNQANAAYAQANTIASSVGTAYGQANAAYAQANSARGQANTAYAQANAAYADANTRVLKSGDTITGTLMIQQTKEKINVAAVALGANLTVDILDGAVTYLTSNATANSTLNIRGNSTVLLDTVLSTGQSMTTVVMVTNGSTGYRIANVQIDGTGVTPKWSGNTTPTANTNSIDVYAFTMIKTAANTYTVLGSKTQFA